MFLPLYLVFLYTHLFCYILFRFASLSLYQYIIPDVFVSVPAMSQLNFTGKEPSLHIRKHPFYQPLHMCDSFRNRCLVEEAPRVSAQELCPHGSPSRGRRVPVVPDRFLWHLTADWTPPGSCWTGPTQSQCLSLLLQIQIRTITVTFLFYRGHRKRGERGPVTK